MPANEGQNEVNEAKTRLIFLFERASKNEVLVWYFHRPQIINIFYFKLYLTAKFTIFCNNQNIIFFYKIDPQ